MVASFSEAVAECGETLSRQWNSSVLVRTAQSTASRTRNSKLAAKDELLDVESLLPQYAAPNCLMQLSCDTPIENGDEKWYEELNDHMMRLVNKPVSKKKFQLNLKKAIRTDSNFIF